MASGHVNRINRPNTWLLRPDVRTCRKSLPTRSRPHMARRGSSRRCSTFSCERLRMPAMTTARHTPTAGVRKRPMDEIAGEGTREGATFAMGIGQPRMRRSSGPDAIDRVAA